VRLKNGLVSSMAAILMAAAWSPANAAVNCADLVNLRILASEIGLPKRRCDDKSPRRWDRAC